MKVAWFHCFNGVAGDMSLGALIDAGADLDVIRSAVSALEITGWSIDTEATQRCGIRATRAIVEASDDEHHRPYSEVRRLLGAAALPERTRQRAGDVFRALAEVEGAIHGVAPDDVEFHEVGARDAIVDVVGTCAALESLGVEAVHCSPIALGMGTFTAAHGVLPNPGPAVVGLLARRRAPSHGVDLNVELTTPTGAALMTALATGFGPMPAMNVETVGYGAGTRDIEGRPNVVQVIVGTVSAASGSAEYGQPVQLLEANLDDVTGEVLGEVIKALLAAGAHDAWVSPIVMKKGRPAHTVHVLCDPAIVGKVSRVLIADAGTFGVRGMVMHRWPQHRQEVVVNLAGHPIRIKLSEHRAKAEFDDARNAAEILGVPVRDIIARAEAAASALRTAREDSSL